MPRHHKKAAVPEAHRPGMDNAPSAAEVKHDVAKSKGKHSKKHEGHAGKHVSTHDAHEGPQATSLPGHIAVIHDVQKPGKGIVGVPGIISSTTLGPEVRHRLVSGIIDTLMGAHKDTGAVHAVAGHDSTAYNEGMVHIAGSKYK